MQDVRVVMRLAFDVWFFPRDGREAAVELDANVMSLLISYSLVCISGSETGSS
jgi:hypothetical protein